MGPASEPETQAFLSLMDRVHFAYNKNDHTFGRLLLGLGAVSLLVELKRRPPAGARIDEALYLLSVALVDAGRSEEAAGSLRQLVDHYPKSTFLARCGHL